MHYYKRNIGDYAKKAGRLSMLQHGSYTLLIDACYDREQFPTREEAIDWTWASTPAEVDAVDFVLSKFFTLEDGAYVQSRIREEISDYQAKATINQRIAIDRETKRREKSTVRVHGVNEPPPNQEPLTTNQEPIDIEANASVASLRLPTCPTQSIVNIYQETLPELPVVRLLSDKRKRAISGFWKFVLTSKRSDGTVRATDAESALKWVKVYFERARNNDFLMGRGKKADGHEGWTCDIDFLMSDKGRKHVIEKTKDAT